MYLTKLLISFFTWLGPLPQMLAFVFLFVCGHTIYLSYNFTLDKYTSKNKTTLFGVDYKSPWIMWTVATFLLLPVLTFANLLFAGTFHFAMAQYGSQEILLVFGMFIAAQVVANVITGYAFYTELPSFLHCVAFVMILAGMVMIKCG